MIFRLCSSSRDVANCYHSLGNFADWALDRQTEAALSASVHSHWPTLSLSQPAVLDF